MIELITSVEVQHFIRKHRDDDPAALMLKGPPQEGFPLIEAVNQIQARQKAKNKLPGWYARDKLVWPPPLSVEQSSSEVTAAFKCTFMKGDRLVDLTGGMGADCFTMAPRFRQVDYVEANESLVEIAEHNAAVFGLDNIHFHHNQAEQFLEATPHHYDWIYLDPSRRKGSQKVFRLEDCLPNVQELHDALLKKGAHVMMKTSPMLDIQSVLRGLTGVAKVMVVSHKNEVKEVLYLLEPEFAADPQIELYELSLEQSRLFSFTPDDEKQAHATFGPLDQYLLEPYPVVMKAGVFKLLSSRFGVDKLGPNTHLYTADEVPAQFPGKVFEVLATCRYDRKSLRTILTDNRANVITRNFPHSVQQVKDKLKIKDGGDHYLFATTLGQHEHVMVLTKRLH